MRESPARSDRAEFHSHPYFPVSTHPNEPDPDQNAEELFFAYLIQREEPEAEDFESLCAHHPEHADALRVLYANLERVGGLISKSNKQESMQAMLASMFGKSLDPGISLEPLPEATESIDGRLEQLSAGAARYEIKDEIARGGMGVILKAWDRDLRRSMAMKTLLADHAPGEGGSRAKASAWAPSTLDSYPASSSVTYRSALTRVCLRT